MSEQPDDKKEDVSFSVGSTTPRFFIYQLQSQKGKGMHWKIVGAVWNKISAANKKYGLLKLGNAVFYLKSNKHWKDIELGEEYD